MAFRVMELISYQEFGRLRIRDFFPEDAQLSLDETGATECAIGPAATEGLAFTYFAWLPEEPRMTAEISLDFREECPSEAGKLILEKIKLPVSPGMSLCEVLKILGEPDFSSLSSEMEGFVRFACGKTWPYFVGCTVSKKQGVIGVIVFRRDYWQEP